MLKLEIFQNLVSLLLIIPGNRPFVYDNTIKILILWIIQPAKP